MAYYRKLKSGLWSAEIERKGIPRFSKSFTTRALAKAWATQIEADITNGNIETALKLAAVRTLKDELADYVKREDVMAHKGFAQELQRSEQIQTYPLAALQMSDIDEDALRAYVATRQGEIKKRSEDMNTRRVLKGLEPGKISDGASSIRNELALISSVFTALIKAKTTPITENPVTEDIKPKPPKHRKRRLKDDEEARILEAAADRPLPQGGGKPRSPGFRVVLLFGMDTAMRLTEILELTWGRVDLKRCIALLEEGETKNDEEREVPLSPRVCQAVADLKASLIAPPGRHDRLFNYTTDGFRSIWYRTLKRAGINNLDLHFHDLRREATSKLFEETDLNVMQVSKVTGHKNLKMLHTYTELDAEKIREKIYGNKEEPEAKPKAKRKAKPAAELSPKERLKQLKGLLDDELITQEEFNAKREQFLESI